LRFGDVDLMVVFWPPGLRVPLAAPMNAIPKIVLSRSGSSALGPTTTLRNATEAQREAGSPLSVPAANWDDTQNLSGELGPSITALKVEPGEDLVAHGGASFAQSLVREVLSTNTGSRSIRWCSVPRDELLRLQAADPSPLRSYSRPSVVEGRSRPFRVHLAAWAEPRPNSSMTLSATTCGSRWDHAGAGHDAAQRVRRRGPPD
jgi:hypothetical protein